jgi:hypothetical protein
VRNTAALQQQERDAAEEHPTRSLLDALTAGVDLATGGGSADSSGDGPGPVPAFVCADGTVSYAQHRQGACSHHGGLGSAAGGADGRSAAAGSPAFPFAVSPDALASPSADTPADPTPDRGKEAAMTFVRSKGMVPDGRVYDARQPLTVILGEAPRGTASSPMQAYFFTDGRYLGTATSKPRPHIAFLAYTSSGLELQYQWSSDGDPNCCPSNVSTVRFDLHDGHVRAQGEFPPAP